jgi:hypothetical protein
MENIIIHRTETNGLAVTYKLDENLSMLEAAYRCVPAGVRFKILDADLFEANVDYDFLEAFDYDFENDYDGIGMTDSEWEDYLKNKEN